MLSGAHLIKDIITFSNMSKHAPSIQWNSKQFRIVWKTERMHQKTFKYRWSLDQSFLKKIIPSNKIRNMNVKYLFK